MTIRNQEFERMVKDISIRDDDRPEVDIIGEFKGYVGTNQRSNESYVRNSYEVVCSQFGRSTCYYVNTERPRVVQEGERFCNNRLIKVEFPKFNGGGVEGWLYKRNHLFSMMKLLTGANLAMLQFIWKEGPYSSIRRLCNQVGKPCHKCHWKNMWDLSLQDLLLV